MGSKIAEVTSFALGRGRGNVIVVRVRTDDGLEGIGEGTINYRVRAIRGAVDDFAMYLAGKDPTQIERHWQALYRNSFFRGGPIQYVRSEGVATIRERLAKLEQKHGARFAKKEGWENPELTAPAA